jgi:hypothetical protein
MYLEWYQAWYTALRKRPICHKERRDILKGQSSAILMATVQTAGAA